MYFNWPIEGSPETAPAIEMIGQVQKTQQKTGNSAIVIHCRYFMIQHPSWFSTMILHNIWASIGCYSQIPASARENLRENLRSHSNQTNHSLCIYQNLIRLDKPDQKCRFCGFMRDTTFCILIELKVDPGAIFKYPFSEKVITFSQFHMMQKIVSTVPISNQFIFGPYLNAITLNVHWRAYN